MRTHNSKNAFNILDRTTIIHPHRRDGGIMECYLDEKSDTLIVDKEKIIENCIAELVKLSGKGAHNNKASENIKLVALEESEIYRI